jgi:hypothetical protein
MSGLQLFSFAPLSGGAAATWVQGRGDAEAAVVEADPVVEAVEPEPVAEPMVDAVGESAAEPVAEPVEAEEVPVVKPKRGRRRRAHDADGTFKADDVQTPAVNEAWQA